MKNKREINKLEREMLELTNYIIHTPDHKAKMLYADKLMSITPTYIRLVYYGTQGKERLPQQEKVRAIYFYEGGSNE